MKANQIDTTMDNIELSVIIPIFNEDSVLPRLYERLSAVLNGLRLPCEIIFIDDGSRDNSLLFLKKLHQEDSRVKVLSFSRNFGHQPTITAGLNFASGKAIMIIDGDLQDPPEIIPAFLEKWKEGYEVVYGIRTKRKENIAKRGFYALYYRLLRKLTKTAIPLDSGDCCLMARKVVDLLNSMPERNRFVRGLRSWIGFKQTGIPYERDKRYAGKSKYTFFKLLKLGLDGIISFSEIPLKMSIVTGFLISGVSLLYSLYLMIATFFNFQHRIPGWASIVVGMTFLGGIQLIVMGFLGEYIIRIFDEVKGRPQYILGSAIGFDPKDVQNLRHHPGV